MKTIKIPHESEKDFLFAFERHILNDFPTVHHACTRYKLAPITLSRIRSGERKCPKEILDRMGWTVYENNQRVFLRN